MGSILGVRLDGSWRLRYVRSDDSDLTVGQRVRVALADGVHAGIIVVAPRQLVEYHAGEPEGKVTELLLESARTEGFSEAGKLFHSLELPPEG